VETIPKTKSHEFNHFSVEVPIKVRKASKEDLYKLEWYGQFIHYRYLFRRSYKEQAKGKRLLLVADSADYPIARLFLQFRGNNKHMANGFSRAYLYSFCVMEMFRGRGIGSRLLDAAEHLLYRKNFRIATIAVAKDNPRALQLYLRRGYRKFAEEEGKWEYKDHRGRLCQVHEPCWLLEKRL